MLSSKSCTAVRKLVYSSLPGPILVRVCNWAVRRRSSASCTALQISTSRLSCTALLSTPAACILSLQGNHLKAKQHGSTNLLRQRDTASTALDCHIAASDAELRIKTRDQG